MGALVISFASIKILNFAQFLVELIVKVKFLKIDIIFLIWFEPHPIFIGNQLKVFENSLQLLLLNCLTVLYKYAQL